MKAILVLFTVLSSLFFVPAHAEESDSPVLPPGNFTELRIINPEQVDQIIDGLRIRLKNKQIIQLSSIEIPGMSPYEPSEAAIKAKDFLTDLLETKEVRIYQTKNKDKGRMNRMGYDLAHLERKEESVWIQGALLANGFARALPSQRNPEMAAQMYSLEQQARDKKKGLWADNHYAILTPNNAESSVGQFVLIEGTVHSVATMKNRIYLNFGPDWHTDFTISIETPIRKELIKAGVNAMQLGNKTVRVRGWLESWNGPHIRLEHSSLLELLPDKS